MNRFAIAVAVAAVVGAGHGAAGQGRADRITVPLSDPSRPVTLDISLHAGIVNVAATDGREIVIEASTPAGQQDRIVSGGANVVLILPGRPAAEPDTSGLKRLQQPTSLEVEESNNLVTVRARTSDRVDLNIQVPVRTSLKLNKSGPSSLGTVTVKGLDGDLEIHTNAGAITLTDVSGSVVAHSMGGAVFATIRRVTPERPMSFTSYSGNVDVTLPRSVKADFILQSDRRDVFTDFDLQLKGAAPADFQQPGGGFRRTGAQPLRAMVNGGGPEFELRTYSGNVYLRRASQ